MPVNATMEPSLDCMVWFAFVLWSQWSRRFLDVSSLEVQQFLQNYPETEVDALQSQHCGPDIAAYPNTANTWHYQLSALVLQLRPDDARPRLSETAKFLVPDTTLNLMPSMAGA